MLGSVFGFSGSLSWTEICVIDIGCGPVFRCGYLFSWVVIGMEISMTLREMYIWSRESGFIVYFDWLFCRSLPALNILVYLWTWLIILTCIPDNYHVHVTINLLGKYYYTVTTPACCTCYIFLLYRYPVHDITYSCYTGTLAFTCWYCYRDYHWDIPVIKVTCILNNLDKLKHDNKQLALGLGKLMEETASVFWVDLGFRLRSRKRVPLQGSCGVTGTLSCLFLFTCSWLPSGRSWFSARSLGRGPGYVRVSNRSVSIT